MSALSKVEATHHVRLWGKYGSMTEELIFNFYLILITQLPTGLMATKLGSTEKDDQRRNYKSHHLQLANVLVYLEFPEFK